MGAQIPYCGIVELRRYLRFPWPWFSLVSGLSIMYLEDSINLRHTTVRIVGSVYFGLDTPTRALRTKVELLFYFLLGSIMLLALLQLFRYGYENVLGKRLLIVGYCLYGIAAVGSATRHIGSWYTVVGTRMLEFITRGAEVSWTGESVIWDRFALGYLFTDFVIEESLELLGAAFLLAALTDFVFFVRKARD